MPIPKDMQEKIALFCNIRKEDVIQNLTAPSLYEVPLNIWDKCNVYVGNIISSLFRTYLSYSFKERR